MTHFETTMDSPLGPLRLLANDEGLCGIYYQEHKNAPELDCRANSEHSILKEAQQQLSEYFSGRRQEFSLPLALEGTPFMLSVWNALAGIPYGTTLTYGQLAQNIGSPKAFRAVGRTNGLNPVSIVLPCHRVVGSNGKLTGYAGGLANKEWLLDHERRIARSEVEGLQPLEKA